MKRTGPLRDRIVLRAMRLSVGLWGQAELVGIDVIGASEGPPLPDPARREGLDAVIAAALDGDGTVDAAACEYPAHELLTHLVTARNLLLHGSNDLAIEQLEPRPARDLRTELHAVVACSDGIWPFFYAVVARDRVQGVFSACVHAGRRRLRRFYVFGLVGADPADETSWTRGAVYALPRDGFRREWGQEWVKGTGSGPSCACSSGRKTFRCEPRWSRPVPGDGFLSIRRRLQAARASSRTARLSA